MKFAKLTIVALSMGLFLASCGGNTEEATTPAVDSVVTEAPAAPVVEEVAPVADSTAAPAAEAAPATEAAPAEATH